MGRACPGERLGDPDGSPAHRLAARRPRSSSSAAGDPTSTSRVARARSTTDSRRMFGVRSRWCATSPVSSAVDADRSEPRGSCAGRHAGQARRRSPIGRVHRGRRDAPRGGRVVAALPPAHAGWPRSADVRGLLDQVGFGLGRLARSSASDGVAGRLAGVAHRCARPARRCAPASAAASATTNSCIVPTGVLHNMPWGGLPSITDRPHSIASSATRWMPPVVRPARPRVVVITGPRLDDGAGEVDAVRSTFARARTLVGSAATVAAALDLLAIGRHRPRRVPRTLPQRQPDVLVARTRRRAADGLRPRIRRIPTAHRRAPGMQRRRRRRQRRRRTDRHGERAAGDRRRPRGRSGDDRERCRHGRGDADVPSTPPATAIRRGRWPARGPRSPTRPTLPAAWPRRCRCSASSERLPPKVHPDPSGRTEPSSGSRPFQRPVDPYGSKRANSSSRYQCSSRVRRTTSTWSGIGVGERPGRVQRVPEAERRQPSDGRFADPDHVDETRRPGAARRSTTRPARPNVRHAPSRTSARVTTAIGPSAVTGVQAVERIDAPPPAVSAEAAQPHVPRLVESLPAPPDRAVARKSIERRVAVPHREQRRAARIDARTRVVGASGAEQPPEHQAGRAVEPEPVGAEPRHRERAAPRGFAHEVERRDPAHRSVMLSVRWYVSTPSRRGCSSPPSSATSLGSIPVANLVTHRRSAVDLRDVGDHNPGYWNAKETLGRRAALPVFVGDVAKGDRRGARRCGARRPGGVGHGVRRCGRGDGRPRLARSSPASVAGAAC